MMGRQSVNYQSAGEQIGEARLGVKREPVTPNQTGRAAEASISIIHGSILGQLQMGLARPRAVRINEFRRPSPWQLNNGFSGGFRDFVLDARC